MTVMLRDRADGQVEVVLMRPEVVGILSDREIARRFVAFLQSEEPELVEEEPAGFATAQADVVEAAGLDLGELVPEPAPQLAGRARRSNLPAVVPDRPMAPVFVSAPKDLTDAELEAAFDRIHGGEKLSAVAQDLGVTMNRLRGLWAAHCRYLQRHIAEGGRQACSLCQRPFTPSVSSPDKCARCSHGG